MKVLDKVCIAGAVGTGREKVALMLSEITGLPVIAYEHADQLNDGVELRGIVFDVASNDRANRMRELGFKVIRYENKGCEKRVSISIEKGEIGLSVLSNDTPRDTYKKLVSIFENELIVRDEVETTGSEDD